jgi:hypothetical protein
MNRDSVLSVYSDARTEYTKQLCVFLVPAYFQFYVELLEKAKRVMIHEPKRALWQFQNYLNEIHDWNMEKVVNEIHVIQVNSGCDYLEDLLTAVFIAHTKVLTAIRLSTNNKKVEINIPKVEHFLFKVLCETAKLLWGSTYLFRDGIPGMEKQQNYRNIENMLHEGIIQAVRSLVPVKSILKDFVNHDSTTDASALKEEEDSDDETEKKEDLTVPPSVDLNTQEASIASVASEVPVPISTTTHEPVSVPAPEPIAPLPQEPSTPVIMLDDKPTVRFGEFNAMFDSDHPSDSDLILESNENEETVSSSDHESGPVLQILEEEGISMENDLDVETLDVLNAPSESIGLNDYEEL